MLSCALKKIVARHAIPVSKCALKEGMPRTVHCPVKHLGHVCRIVSEVHAHYLAIIPSVVLKNVFTATVPPHVRSE